MSFLSEVLDLALLAPPSAPGNVLGVTFAAKGLKTVGVVPFGTGADWGRVRAWLADLVPLLRAARPFVFDGVPFERDATGRALLPGLDEDGRRLFNRGTARPPFDVCWFEIPTDADASLGLLVVSTATGIDVYEFERAAGERPFVRIICYRVTYHRDVPEAPLPPGWTRRPDGPEFLNQWIEDPFGHFAALMAVERAAPGGAVSEETLTAMVTRESLLAIYCTLLLASNAVEVTTRPAGVLTNRRRRDRGLPPLHEERRVSMLSDWRPGPMVGDPL